MNEDKEISILMEMYEQMYKEAEPSVDLQKLIKSGETKKDDWFLKYYLSEERIEEIVIEVCKKHNIKHPRTQEDFLTEVLLGASPTSDRTRWEEERQKDRGKKDE